MSGAFSLTRSFLLQVLATLGFLVGLVLVLFVWQQGKPPAEKKHPPVAVGHSNTERTPLIRRITEVDEEV